MSLIGDKLKFVALAMVVGAAMVAQAEDGDSVSWTVNMSDNCLSPYTDSSKSECSWYPNTTVYLLDANLVDASAVQSQLEKGDRSVLTGAGYLAQTNGVNAWPIKNWTMPTGGKKISVTGGLFDARSDVLLVYLTDTSTTPPKFAVSQMTASVYLFSEDPSAIFTEVGDSGVWTAFPQYYVAPEYVDGVASKGIDHWTTNAVPSGYTVVESAASRVTWGEAGATNWYVVIGDDVQIDGGVQCAGYVNLVLCNGAKLTVTNCAENHAGIQTDASGSFTIYGTSEGAGELTVTAGEQGAGIGGGKKDAGSHITINGGTVKAAGGIFAASIGGGAKGTGSDITINGGSVTASGVVQSEETSAAAGIGGGNYGNGSDITINGGMVTAVGLNLSAGIGGGSNGNGSNITINDGVVKTVGSFGGAGIGGGSEGNGSNIAINGGTISAIACVGGAAIGGGQTGTGSNVKIANAAVSVQAVATYYEGDYYVAEFIGNGMMAGAEATDIEIDASAKVLFNLTGLMSGEGGYIEETMASPEDFEGFVIMTPATQTLERTLVGGCGAQGLSSLPAFALTNAATAATGTIAVNDTPRRFASANLKLKHADSQLTLDLFDATQVGNDAWADIEDGDCTIFGSGATWAKSEWKSGNPLKSYDAAITNLVVTDGITGLGANSFENMWYLRNVELAASVTAVGDRAFKKCYGLTNVTSLTTESAEVGEYAFSGCHSLNGLSFAGSPTFGTQAYTMQAAIYLTNNDIPVVYAMPTITVAGKSEHILGKKTLNEDNWTDVTNASNDEKKKYHFFKIEMQ